jgi:hypothetical protein
LTRKRSIAHSDGNVPVCPDARRHLGHTHFRTSLVLVLGCHIDVARRLVIERNREYLTKLARAR